MIYLFIDSFFDSFLPFLLEIVNQLAVICRQNAAYEESEEDDIDDGEDEDDDDDYESEVPALPQKQQVSRPVSAQRRVEVQPGPSRDPKRTVAAMQKTSAASKRRQEEESDDDDDDDDDDSEEDDLSQRVPSTKPAKEVRTVCFVFICVFFAILSVLDYFCR